VHVYLAGPLFTPYERRFVDELAGLLREDGFEVFVPHEQEYLVPAHDVGPGAVFETDGRGIDAADALVAILDGPVVDDGTACEIGLFTGLARTDPAKKGIVGLLDRQSLGTARGTASGGPGAQPLRAGVRRVDRVHRRRACRCARRPAGMAAARDHGSVTEGPGRACRWYWRLLT
jgi:hypothetical protein